jgi:putative hydrolase of the HAD superfamily
MEDDAARRHIRYLTPIPSAFPPGGRLLKPIRTVLFDIYGTLFISGCGDIGTAPAALPPGTAFTEMLRRYAIDAPAMDVIRRLHHEIHVEHQRKRAMGIANPEVDIEMVWQKVLGWPEADRLRAFALEYEWMVNPSYPMPGLSDILRILRRRKLVMGLISNAQFYTPLLFQWFLGARPEELGIDADLTIFSYRFGIAKPSITLFKTCYETLTARGLPASAVVYVGNDMRNDILPASSLGWQTALFAGDRRSLRLRRDRAECRGVRPDLVITDLRQLREWI